MSKHGHAWEVAPNGWGCTFELEGDGEQCCDTAVLACMSNDCDGNEGRCPNHLDDLRGAPVRASVPPTGGNR